MMRKYEARLSDERDDPEWRTIEAHESEDAAEIYADVRHSDCDSPSQMEIDVRLAGEESFEEFIVDVDWDPSFYARPKPRKPDGT